MSVSLQFITTMLNFTTKFVFDRKKTASSTKEGTVELRLTYNRKQKYISTGITVLPKNWRSNMVTGRLDALEINEYLDILSRDARRIVNSMIEEGFIDLNDVPRRINELRRHGVDMFAYFRQRISVRSYGKATTYAESCGGGGSFGSGWGRDKDEDDDHWWRRCIAVAAAMMRPAEYRMRRGR